MLSSTLLAQLPHLKSHNIAEREKNQSLVFLIAEAAAVGVRLNTRFTVYIQQVASTSSSKTLTPFLFFFLAFTFSFSPGGWRLM